MRKNSSNIIIFYIVNALFWFSLYAYVPIFPAFVEDKGVSYTFLGLIIGSYGIAQMLLRIPVGIVSDRIRKRKIFVVAGMLFSIMSCIGLWFFDSPGLIFVSRLIAGCAASMFVVYSVLFSSYFKTDDAPKAIGYLMSVTVLGQVSASYGGGIIARWLGDEYTFLLALTAGLIGLVLSFTIKENIEEKKVNITTAQLISVAKDKNLILVSVLAIVSQYLTFATTFGFTPLAAKELGADSYQLGLLLTLTSLPGILAGAMSGAVFGKRFGEKNVITVGFLLIAATIFVIPFSKSLEILFLSQMVGGFAKGVVFPLLMGMSIKNIERNKRASAMGFYQAIYAIGMFAGPFIVGISTDLISLKLGFVFAGLIGLLGAFIAAAFLNSKKDEMFNNK